MFFVTTLPTKAVIDPKSWVKLIMKMLVDEVAPLGIVPPISPMTVVAMLCHDPCAIGGD